MKPKMSTRELTKTALCVALLCISSYISFPIPFTPIVITAQTLVVSLIGLILNPMESFLSTLIFMLLGCVGLPVFSGGTAGIGKLFGPTGGFIIGFLAAAPLISFTKGKKSYKIFSFYCVDWNGNYRSMWDADVQHPTANDSSTILFHRGTN